MKSLELTDSVDATPVDSGLDALARPFRTVARLLRDPASATVSLILLFLLLHIAFAALLGLGIDESYTVATARAPQFSYFDHPPLAWWLTHAASVLFGSEQPLAARLPFIGLFAVSTWLMFRLTTQLFSPRAGFHAALLFNLSPVFGIAAASWVLPDGPLDCALLGTALCLVRALGRGRDLAFSWWIGVGLCAGLALSSKYSAVLVLAGIPVALATDRRHRRWLARPEPYIAATIAFVLFLPVIEWNAEHGWASFLFQGGRAAGFRVRPWEPVVTLAGETLFLLPWIGLPALAQLDRVLRRGPRLRWPWLLACLAAGPILGFAAVSFWARGTVLFHWAAPGYLFLMPLLGRWVAARIGRAAPWLRRSLVATAALVVAAGGLVASEARWNWLPEIGEDFALGRDPDIQVVNWDSVAQALEARDLLRKPAVVASTNWRDAGKLDYALGGRVPVICLCDDAREYGVLRPLKDFVGRDIVIASNEPDTERAVARYERYFHDLTPEGPVMIDHAGTPSAILYLYVGHGLRLPHAP